MARRRSGKVRALVNIDITLPDQTVLCGVALKRPFNSHRRPLHNSGWPLWPVRDEAAALNKLTKPANQPSTAKDD